MTLRVLGGRFKNNNNNNKINLCASMIEACKLAHSKEPHTYSTSVLSVEKVGPIWSANW
jgi:hypothetical protein